MATIRSSNYVGPIKASVEDIDRRLLVFAKTLDAWVGFQKRWIHLEQIFTTSDIQRQLPQETKLYSLVKARKEFLLELQYATRLFTNRTKKKFGS
jgi:dynein heavy chain